MSQAQTATFFDAYAHDFNAIYGNDNTFFNRLINRFFRKSMRLRYEKTLAGCDPVEGRRVLDVGCGPGHYGIALARRGAAHVFGIDFAPAMIELAQEQAARAGVADRCRFMVGDVFNHPLTEHYDCAVVMGFLDYVAEPRKLVELVLAATNELAFFSFPAAGGLLAWQRKLRYRSRCPLYLYTAEQLRELFRDVPCRDAKIERMARDFFVTVTL